MHQYQIIKKKTLESLEKYEKRINDMAAGGWKAISMSSDHSSVIVLMEKTKR